MTQTRPGGITSKPLNNNDAPPEDLEKPRDSLRFTPGARTALEFADTEPDGTAAIARCYELVHSADGQSRRATRVITHSTSAPLPYRNHLARARDSSKVKP